MGKKKKQKLPKGTRVMSSKSRDVKKDRGTEVKFVRPSEPRKIVAERGYKEPEQEKEESQEDENQTEK